MKKNLEIDSTSKRFSVKRGKAFFWRSHLFLGIMTLLLLISWNSWHYDGMFGFVGFLLLTEVMIISLTFIACLKPRVYKG